MKRQIHILIISAFFVGCSTQSVDIAGTYKSHNPSLVKKGWKKLVEGYDGFITGSELELNRDSSFQKITCGNILTGKWYATNDTIYLKYETNEWRNDSLQQNGFEGKWPKVPKDVQKVVFIENKIIFNWESSEGDKFYDVLIKK
jgi:hypothetical protein